MNFSRIFLNRLHNQREATDTVVVIDVLRSFTTAAVALDRGAQAVYPVESLTAAVGLCQRLDDVVSIGAVGGGDPVPGFDFGNSPAAVNKADLFGRHVVMSTAAGVRGLQRFRHARRLFAASLVNARATAEAVRKAGADNICFVITGEWVDRDGDEDIACADYMEALLRGRQPLVADFAERVRLSDFGQRFESGAWPNLPATDLQLAMQVDRFSFAMAVEEEAGLLVIRK